MQKGLQYQRKTLVKPKLNESNISPSSVQHSCSVKFCIRLATCSAVLGAALRS